MDRLKFDCHDFPIIQRFSTIARGSTVEMLKIFVCSFFDWFKLKKTNSRLINIGIIFLFKIKWKQIEWGTTLRICGKKCVIYFDIFIFILRSFSFVVVVVVVLLIFCSSSFFRLFQIGNTSICLWFFNQIIGCLFWVWNCTRKIEITLKWDKEFSKIFLLKLREQKATNATFGGRNKIGQLSF